MGSFSSKPFLVAGCSKCRTTKTDAAKTRKSEIMLILCPITAGVKTLLQHFFGQNGPALQMVRREILMQLFCAPAKRWGVAGETLINCDLSESVNTSVTGPGLAPRGRPLAAAHYTGLNRSKAVVWGPYPTSALYRGARGRGQALTTAASTRLGQQPVCSCTHQSAPHVRSSDG